MDNARHQIALIDRNGKIIYINYIQYTGVDKIDMIGTCLYDYLSERERNKVKRSVENIFDGKAFDRVAFELELPDKGTAYIELVATPVIIDKAIRYVALIGYQR